MKKLIEQDFIFYENLCLVYWDVKRLWNWNFASTALVKKTRWELYQLFVMLDQMPPSIIHHKLRS